MADYKMNAILRLREDTLENYEKVQDSFIPKNGEVCLVITNNGIKAKIGDKEQHTFRNLPWADMGIFGTGYYYYDSVGKKGHFYKDSAHTILIDELALIYMDLTQFILYYFDGIDYKKVNAVKPASATEAGILKLYTDLNDVNEDGSVTQKAIKQKFDSWRIQVDARSGDAIVDFVGFNIDVVE